MFVPNTVTLNRRRGLVAALAMGLVLCLALCLVLSQALWLLHRIAHAGMTPHVVAVQSSESTEAASVHRDAGSWIKSLLPDHQDERSCALYDHLSHADLAPGFHSLDVTQQHLVVAQATHRASGMAAQAAGFLARGPPADV